MSQPSWSPALRATVVRSEVAGARVIPKAYAAGGQPEDVPGFNVVEEVGNFQVVDDQGRARQGKTSAVRLTIVYSQKAVEAAGGNKEDLKLGLYIGNQWQIHPWTDLTDLNPNAESGGRIRLEVIGDLSDPAVAWGSG
jgi:hypothetical protein